MVGAPGDPTPARYARGVPRSASPMVGAPGGSTQPGNRFTGDPTPARYARGVPRSASPMVGAPGGLTLTLRHSLYFPHVHRQTALTTGRDHAAYAALL